MRSVAVASLLSLAVVCFGAPASSVAAATPFDSIYQFESAFLGGLKPGDTGMFSVFFANTGTTTWMAGTATQVNLAVCAADKVTCAVASPNAAWNSGSWLSPMAYATHTKTSVAAGDFSAFTYSVTVPANAAPGSYRFNGDLVIAASGARIHPEGYYQDATVLMAAAALAAPSDVQVQVGNLDQGTKNDDVRVFFTAPATNPLTKYDIQRAPGHCGITVDSQSWFTVQTLTLTGGVFGAYNDLDRPNGFWCYQVRVNEPSGGAFVYSKQVEGAIFGASTLGPLTSTSAVLTHDGGVIGTLDAGDVFAVTFNEAASLSQLARMRLTDADCGAPASQSSGPASCTSPTTQTVSDVICGSNANCVLSLDGTILTVTMTASPVVVTPGSVQGAQFPVDIVASNGIQDLGGNPWIVSTSADRVIGPQGQ